MPRLLLDLSPLRHRDYRRLWLGGVVSGLGTSFTAVAVGLQVYEVTGSTSSVGLVGLAALVPLVLAGLLGGAVIDAIDRRLVLVASTLGLAVVAALFAVQAWAGNGSVGVLYALVAVNSGLFGINAPARAATVPRLLPAHLLPAAQSLNWAVFGLTMSAGPLLAALLVEGAGFAAAYAADAALALVAVATLAGLPSLPSGDGAHRPGPAAVLAGFRYAVANPDVRATFVLDLAAMVLAMPRVLFPAVASVAVGVGPSTVGVLTAALAAGYALAGVLSGPFGRVRRQGRAVVVAILVWGSAVACFGAVVALAPGPRPGGDAVRWALAAASACLVVAGAADAVSGVFRVTILQVATTDEFRGRVQGVFTVVVAGGPGLGDVVLGTVAGVAGEAVAGVGGGLACVAVVLALAAGHRTFLARESATVAHTPARSRPGRREPGPPDAEGGVASPTSRSSGGGAAGAGVSRSRR